MKYFKARDYLKAIENFERAVKINPLSSVSWSNMGVAYEKLGKSQDSILSYEEAIKIDPQDSATWFNLGRLFKSLGAFKKAMQCFTEVLKIDPVNIEAEKLLDGLKENKIQ